MWLCFLYYTRIVVIIEVVMYYVDIWLIEVHHHPLIWNNIVHMHWHEIEYKLGTWRSSVRKLFDIMIECVEILHTNTWRLSVSVYGPRESPMGHELSMYFWGVSCIYGWESTDILRYIIPWYHIALNFMTSFNFMIMCFYWWLGSVWFSLPLFDETWLVNIL